MDEWTTGLGVALGVEFGGIFHGRVVLKQSHSCYSVSHLNRQVRNPICSAPIRLSRIAPWILHPFLKHYDNLLYFGIL